MPAHISRLPFDILQCILEFVDLEDAVSFSMVCTVFQTLTSKRSIWISVLKRARDVKPIAFPSHEDLTLQPLDSLKRIILHTLRLESNWSLPEPRIIGPVKAVLLEEFQLDIIFQIPATGLFLMHCRESASMVLWDIVLGKAASSVIPVGKRVVDVSPGQDEPGEFSMALLIQDDVGALSITIVRVEHDKPEPVVGVTFNESLPFSHYHWALFMNEEIVGVLQSPTIFPATITFLAFNRLSPDRKATISSDIQIQDVIGEGHSGSSSVGCDVFLLAERGNISRQYCCPAELLPYNWNLDCPKESNLKCAHIPPISWDYDTRFVCEQLGALSAHPRYGIPAVSLHGLHVEDASEGDPMPYIQIRFWARSKTPSPNLLSVCHVDVPGRLWSSTSTSWELMLLPHSGLQVLLLVHHHGLIKLQLVRYHPETNAATVHHLRVPQFIDMQLVYGLALDDHLGAVSLLSGHNTEGGGQQGTIFTIPYA
ncbi:hypothetical protein BDQ12DRAFT_42619 [Crucibulum laeve]|uniref:F-box domain-containing protein n=1 Tax=Crucibulum laeve TaxID=68775 RepID=A0A5C3MLY1_9AGAR|nr:hypothetical protein BDQ12DRAFT_42619 [Crucibulum laeve]